MKNKAIFGLVVVVFCLCFVGCTNSNETVIYGDWYSYGLIEDGDNTIQTYEEIGLDTPSDYISISEDDTVVYHGTKIDSNGTITSNGDGTFEMKISYVGIGETIYNVKIQDELLVLYDDSGNDLVFRRR